MPLQQLYITTFFFHVHLILEIDKNVPLKLNYSNIQIKSNFLLSLNFLQLMRLIRQIRTLRCKLIFSHIYISYDVYLFNFYLKIFLVGINIVRVIVCNVHNLGIKIKKGKFYLYEKYNTAFFPSPSVGSGSKVSKQQGSSGGSTMMSSRDFGMTADTVVPWSSTKNLKYLALGHDSWPRSIQRPRLSRDLPEYIRHPIHCNNPSLFHLPSKVLSTKNCLKH